MIQFFAYIWLFFILYLDVISDYDKWVKNIPISHVKEAFDRALLLIPTMFCLLYPFKFDGVVDFLLNLSTVIGIMFSIYWEFFDGFYNRIRGFKWRFNGSIDKDDSILDRFLYKIGYFWEGILKWSLILLFNYDYWRN